jgi:hypothetical protein
MYVHYQPYLTEKQYHKICKYWKKINHLQFKIEHFDFSEMDYCENSEEDEEIIRECENKNAAISAKINLLRSKLFFLQEEYVNYIDKIGMCLLDRSQNEILFQLINDGLIIQ